MSKSSGLRQPSGSQLEILAILNHAGKPLSAAEVWIELSKTREIARPTVATQLERMEAAGWVIRDGSGRKTTFQASYSFDTAETEIARGFLSKFFESSVSRLVSSLLGSGQVSKDELERLRELIEKEKQQLDD